LGGLSFENFWVLELILVSLYLRYNVSQRQIREQSIGFFGIIAIACRELTDKANSIDDANLGAQDFDGLGCNFG
jgi:hypothetical protein